MVASARAPRIDVHAHFLPDDYRTAALAAHQDHPDGMPALPTWDVGNALALMDSIAVRTAMLSISSPGVHFGDDASARDLARSCNRQGMELVRTHGNRFGLFAALPLPDIAGAIAEAIHALDEMGADGVMMESNHHGLYMGDPRLDPLMSELDRRRAVIFLHPTSPSCTGCLDLAFGQPRPILEFIFETTRAVGNMLYHRTLQRFPGIRLIVPHAGAALPILAHRIADQAGNLRMDPPMTSDEVFSTLRRLHYDIAGSPVPTLARALLDVADPGQIHYGSDCAFTPDDVVVALADAIDSTDVFDDRLRRRVLLDNSLALFPRLNAS